MLMYKFKHQKTPFFDRYPLYVIVSAQYSEIVTQIVVFQMSKKRDQARIRTRDLWWKLTMLWKESYPGQSWWTQFIQRILLIMSSDMISESSQHNKSHAMELQDNAGYIMLRTLFHSVGKSELRHLFNN